MSVPSVPSSYPAPITAAGEANGILIDLSQKSPDGPPATLKLGVSGTYGTATLVVRARLLGMTNFFPIAGVDAGSGSAVGTGGSIALTANTSYLFKFPVGGYDAVEAYLSSYTTGQADLEQAVGPAESVTPPIVNATTTTALSGNSTVAGTFTITSNSAAALTVGPNGATNPVLKVNGNTASAATGLQVVGAAAAGGCAVSVISSGTNEALTIDAKGSGTITLNGTGTGNVVLGAAAVGNSSIKSIHATAGLGYGTGAGGTVTQGTSITTGVTLNTVCGTITTVSSTLAAGVDASFTLTNSAIAATDVVVASIKSYGGTADGIPVVAVQATAAGSCILNIRNTGAVTLDAAIVISFAVVKAVAA